jgi:phosphate transport system substrate-binding protein
MEKYREMKVVVTGGGSSTGVTSVANGIVDIGTCSRELTEKEAAVLSQYKIALDGIAVIVHPSLTVKSLTTEQVAAIFTGKITNWKEVGGPDMRIDVVTRESGSGTRDTFEFKALNYQGIIDRALQQPSNGAVRTTVAGLPSSIGYISIAYIDDSVQGLILDGIKPTFENVDNGAWRLMRPLLLLTRGPAKGKAKDFIDFCLSPEGQEIVTSEMYAGVE